MGRNLAIGFLDKINLLFFLKIVYICVCVFCGERGCDNLFLAQESDGDVMVVSNDVTSFILVLYHNPLVHMGILLHTLYN